MTMSNFGGWGVGQNSPQITCIDPQLLVITPRGDSPKDTQEDGEHTPQAADVNPQYLLAHLSPGGSPKATQEDGEDIPQASDINLELVFSHSSLGDSTKDTQEGHEDTPQAANAYPQFFIAHPSPRRFPKYTQEGDGAIPQAADVNPRNAFSHSTPRGHLKDIGVVMGPQREMRKERAEKIRYQCGFLGKQCKFMDKDGFVDCAKLKADAIRHINGYQCLNCGGRFGKPYSLNRHRRNKGGCTKRKFKLVHPELQKLLRELEKSKGQKQITVVINQCIPYCDMNGISQKARKNKHSRAPAGTQHQTPQVPDVPETPGIPLIGSEATGRSHINSDIEGGSVYVDGGEFAQQRGSQALDIASNTLEQGANSTGMHYLDYPETISTDSGEVGGADEYSVAGPFSSNYNTSLRYEGFSHGQSYSHAPGIIDPQESNIPVTSASPTACSATTGTDTASGIRNYNSTKQDLIYSMSNYPFVHYSGNLTTDCNQLPIRRPYGDQQSGYVRGSGWPPN